MSRNGSGTYVPPTNSWNPAVNGVSATAVDWQSILNDLSAALTQSVSRDGQAPMTGNLPMAGNKLTGLGAGVATGDSLRWEQLFDQGVETDVASAATTDIGIVNSNFLRITGTTTITSFGTNYKGPRFVRFGGVLTLTHNATTLILPTGANITTASGDRAIITPVGNPSSGWQVLAYQKADGGVLSITPVALGGTGASNANDAVNNLGAFGRSYLAGLTLSTAGSSATFSVAAGEAVNSTNAAVIKLVASINKTTSAWTVGSGNGSLDTGSIANSTWYHAFLIRRTDTGVVDVLISLSPTSPTLPANYTQFRRIGSLRTNGSAQWVRFFQDGDLFQWETPILDVNSASSGTSAVTRTLTVPSGVNVRSFLNVQVTAGGTGEATYLSDLATSDVAPSATAAPLTTLWTISGNTSSVQAQVRTNTSSQIRSRQLIGGASETLRIATLGWFDSRGKDA